MDKNSLQYQLYKLDDENEINALVKDETVWLTQKAMGELFEVDRTSITRHLKNIFESGELEEKVVCAEIEHTTQHGALTDKTQTKEVKIYNLDAIISVGYRVNSLKATRFRQWATKILEDFTASIDEFLKFRRYKILSGKGNISKMDAERKARLEYDAYNKTPKINSDFEKKIAKVKEDAKR